MNNELNLLVIDGGVVKTSIQVEGLVEGLGIVFGSEQEPDQSEQRDFFTKESMIRKRKSFSVPLYYEHGFGQYKSEIGEAVLTKGTDGWHVRGQIDTKDPDGSQVYERVKTSPHGFSTGALQHLVQREAKSNNTNFLKQWVVGELSLTERPAERKAQVYSVKSLDNKLIEETWKPEMAIKGVSGVTGLPLASRNKGWDASAAAKRVRKWAGVTDKANAKYKKAFFWWDSSNPDNLTSGKLPFADVVNGKLVAVPKGLFAVAQRLDQTNISESDKSAIKTKVASYYAKMRKEFSDTGIVAPWDAKKSDMNKKTDGEIVAIYDENGNKIWDKDDGVFTTNKSINGSVTYSISSYSPETESGTEISVYEWGGIDDFIQHLQDIVNAAAAAVQADTANDAEDETTEPLETIEGQMDAAGKSTDFDQRVRSVVNAMLKKEGKNESDLNPQTELETELADLKTQLSSSDEALAIANERIAQLEIIAGAKETINKYKGK